MKIVIIGAGSHSFGRGQIADILTAGELRGRGVTLSLVDLDNAGLDLMTRYAQRLRDHLRSDITIESATERVEALPGANYVITAVARRRMELWEQDFRVPLACGFRHCLGENGGPTTSFIYGNPSDVPIVGDWDNDGSDTVGVVRGVSRYLRNSNTAGVADVSFDFGNTGDVQLVWK